MARGPWIVAVTLLAAVAPVAAGAQASPFTMTVARVSAADLRWSYRPGCPVPPSGLRLVHLPYWGYDGRSHRGSLVVNSVVVTAVGHVFATLYAERFPIRRMDPVEAFGGSDDRSMAADNTSGFNCRYAVTTGPRQWSAHAYGEAIDVNPVENPYELAGRVYPSAGEPYLDRADVRPGMAVPGGQLVAAFAAVGWQWGGRWAGSPDYQHFSSTGG
jgi:D-alanyl-D-alanine carboxypeptidase